MKGYMQVASMIAFSVMSGQAMAASLTSGATLAAPGSTVTVPVELLNSNGVEFTSIDAAIRISGQSGDLPLILGFDAPPTEPFVWEPFSSVNYIPSPNNPLALPASGEVLGVTGSDRGVFAKSEGRVMDVSISIPAAAVPGQVFQIDLLEDLSFIGSLGVAERFTEPLQDGSLTIVTDQILVDYDCIQTNLFTENACGDMNDDGLVDGSDLNIILDQINALGAPAAVPEARLGTWLIALLALSTRAQGAERRRIIS